MIVEGFKLDTEQEKCVKIDAHNHLVVAGAGTGKTTTMIGRVKYLLENGLAKDSDILVLSFTNASAHEMDLRLKKELANIKIKNDFNGIPTKKLLNVKASTFHAFGFEILKKVANKKLKVISDPTKVKNDDEVDFSDMIIKATKYINDGKYINPYKYIIVDEFQDISMPRYDFLMALRKSSDYNLFCVGDDWQSIYKFNGSEIDLMLNFEKYFGPTTISKICHTYRYPQSIADVSAKFITENPKQIKKKIIGIPDKTKTTTNFFGRKKKIANFAISEIVGPSDKANANFFVSKLNKISSDSSVYFLGRHNRDIKNLPSSDLVFLTVHKSKGLQADYVFVMFDLDTKTDIEEERRLFYVALTRAKKRVFLSVVYDHKSDFVRELEDRYYKIMPRYDLCYPAEN